MRALSFAAFTCVLCFSLSSSAQQAQAQAPTPTPAPAPTPPDVVLQKDGGMLRGTISELVPGDVVVIMLGSGEQRKIPMANVEYAGPASEMAARRQAAQAKPDSGAVVTGEATPPSQPEGEAKPKRPKRRPTTAQGQDVEVPLTSDPDGIRFHIHTGESVGEFSGLTYGNNGGWTSGTVKSDTFRALCEAPCSTTLKPGNYVFGLSDGAGTPVKAEGLLAVSDGTALHGKYESYAALRTAGWVTLVGSLIAGTTMTVLSFHHCDVEERDCEPMNMPLMISGVVVAGVGSLAGVLMAGKKDEAAVSYETGSAEAKLRGPRFVLRREPAAF